MYSTRDQVLVFDVKCIESAIHSVIYTTFVLGTINSMMNLKQFSPIGLICVETKWPGVDSQWLYLVVGHLC